MVVDETMYYKIRKSGGSNTVSMPRDADGLYSRTVYEDGRVMFKPKPEPKTKDDEKEEPGE